MQENKAREGAEVQRRHRDRLQSATKRRSTATCSSRDKEMDGVALESVLQNFVTNRVSRRRLGRPSPHGSPKGGSPKNGSLSEITSQVNLPTGNPNRGAFFRIKEMGKKEWNSAGELTGNSSQMKPQSDKEYNKETSALPHEEDRKTSRKDDSRVLTPSVSRTTSISSTGRSFSAATEDGEDELQDNNEEEAQKLREVSRKVLRFQNSCSSVSSGEFSFENQKSPGAGTALPRQRTFDEEIDRYPGDPTNEDLVTYLLGSQTSSKRNLGRRHTLPTKVPKTEEEQDHSWTPIKTPSSAAREKKGAMPAEGAGQNPSNQVFDFTNMSHISKDSDAEDQNFPSAEKKTKPNMSVTHVPEEGRREQNQEAKSAEPTDNNLQRNGENIPRKSTWIKTETSGIFLSFFKRLGDMSKLPNTKETVQKCTDSSV